MDDVDGQQWVAVAAVVVRGDTLLALRRGPTRVGAGLWETVAGRVRAGEDPLDAITREVVEETGLRVRITPRPVDAYAAKRATDAMTVIVYRADYVGGELVTSDEHDDHAWLDLPAFAARTTLTRLVLAAQRVMATSPDD